MSDWLRIIGHDAPPMTVRVEPAIEREPDERVDAAWSEIASANPRAFNGPVLSFVSDDPATNTITAQRDEYKRLAVMPGIETGVVQLGVTGILVAPDHAGEPHVLLGRRSASTRIYGGMWELAPSGGIDPPPSDQDHLDEVDLWRALRLEIIEELGLPGEPDPARPIAVCRDPEAHSVDVVIAVRLDRSVEELIAMSDRDKGSSSWEYDATRWVAAADCAAFVERESPAVIPPTRDLAFAFDRLPI